MEDKILKYLLDKGKITQLDIREATDSIPTQFELDLIMEIHDCYCPLSHDHDMLECDFRSNKEGLAMNLYLSLLPLLRDKCSSFAVAISNMVCSDVICDSDPYVLEQGT